MALKPKTTRDTIKTDYKNCPPKKSGSSTKKK